MLGADMIGWVKYIVARKVLTNISWVLFLYMAAISVSEAQNLVSNGDFSSGFTGWTTSGSSAFTDVNNYGFSGTGNTYAYFGFNGGQTGGASQTLSLTPGSSYNISFDLARSTNASGVAGSGGPIATDGEFTATFGSNTILDLFPTLSFDASPYTFSNVVFGSGDPNTISFFGTVPSIGEFDISNVSVEAAPGPIPGAGLLSYIALGLFGLGSAGFKRWRRRSTRSDVGVCHRPITRLVAVRLPAMPQ
jgi:hypothetical protein